jgi:hypothetical protein
MYDELKEDPGPWRREREKRNLEVGTRHPKKSSGSLQ